MLQERAAEQSNIRSFEAYRMEAYDRNKEKECLAREFRADVHRLGLRLARTLTEDIARSIRVARVEKQMSWVKVGQSFQAFWGDDQITDLWIFGMLLCKYAAATFGENFRGEYWLPYNFPNGDEELRA